VDPDEPFDAAAYKALGRQAIAELTRRGQTPIVVAAPALHQGPAEWIVPSDARDPGAQPAARRGAGPGPGSLSRAAEAVRPQTAARLHPNDAIRILRALEVFEVTGRPISELQRNTASRTRRSARSSSPFH